MVLDAIPEGPTNVAYTQRFDYDGSGNMIYHGWARAQLNAATSDKKWAIQKLTYSSNKVVLQQWACDPLNWADTAQAFSWDDRASLTYQ